LSSGLVCLSLAGMGANFIVAPTTEAPNPSPIQQKIAAPFKSKPNVYYIILDAYGREDQLRKQFGFDNSPMTTSLKKNGFKVLSNSYTAFPVTEYSVSSTLLMKPVLSASKKPYLDRFISPVFNRFRNAGYQIAVLDGRSCAHGAICLTNDGQGVGTFGNLVQNLLRLTVLYEVILKFAPYLYGDLRATVYDLQVILNEITFEQPTFIYAHIMFPHPPYTRTANCNVQITDNLIDVEDFLFKSRDMYIDQLKCVNRQVINFLPDLLKRDPEAIIVLQSDHGPGFVYRENSQDTDFNFPDSKPWSQDALEERYAILNAWYFPAKCQRLLSDTMPTIDTFLVIFSCLQGTSFSPNKNESFWVDRTREMRVYKIRKGDDWLLKNQ